MRNQAKNETGATMSPNASLKLGSRLPAALITTHAIIWARFGSLPTERGPSAHVTITTHTESEQSLVATSRRTSVLPGIIIMREAICTCRLIVLTARRLEDGSAVTHWKKRPGSMLLSMLG